MTERQSSSATPGAYREIEKPNNHMTIKNDLHHLVDELDVT